MVPLYERITEEKEHQREIRIKENAELSLINSKLPPRMAEHEEKMKEMELVEKARDGIDDYTFQPPRAKPVPDFDRLQTQFQQSLERNRSSKATTIPQPFQFNEPRINLQDRCYMDDINKPEEKVGRAKSANERLAAAKVAMQKPDFNPPTTKKVEAAMRKRREEIEYKEAVEEFRQREDIQRMIKQQQLSQRVRCSPAIIDSSDALRERQDNLKRAMRLSTMQKENQYA